MPGKWDGKSRISNDKYRDGYDRIFKTNPIAKDVRTPKYKPRIVKPKKGKGSYKRNGEKNICLLYTSPSPRDQRGSRMPSSA